METSVVYNDPDPGRPYAEEPSAASSAWETRAAIFVLTFSPF
jgi:hypothetical protein